MAEKPRLKKSDEILGSIAADSGRAAKRGGAEPPADSEKERRGRGVKIPDLKISEPPDDFDEEPDSPEQQAVLPSAQSLAEKLLAHNDKRKQLNFEKYELPKREKQPSQQPVRREEPVAAPAPKAAERRPEPPPAPAQPPARRASSQIEYPASAEPAPPARSVPVEFSPAGTETTAAAPSGAQFEFGAAPDISPSDISFSNDTPDSGRTSPRPARPARTAVPRAPAGTAPATERPTPPTGVAPAGVAPAGVAPFPERPSAPVVSEYTFASFDEEPSAAPTREFSIEQGESNENRRSRERGRRNPQHGNDAETPPEQEAIKEPDQPKIIRPQQPPVAATRTAPDNTGAEPAPQRPADEPRPVQEPRHASRPERVSDEDRSRMEFLDRISNQFELQFEEKFEQGALKERGKTRAPENSKRELTPREEAKPARREPPRAETVAEPPQDEDFFTSVQRQRGSNIRSDAETLEPPDERPLRGIFEESGAASSFIAQFEQETREEERHRDEDFKETLAEKFERERERYLKELEIARGGDELPARPDDIENLFTPAPQTQRRKLDFQIQPEMHTQNGAPPAPRNPAASGPVTYTRGGATRPQIPAADDNPASRTAARQPYQNAAGLDASRKKTSEQLLMELGQRPKTAAQPAPAQKPLKFTFATPEEQSKSVAKPDKPAKPAREPLLPKEKWPRRIMLIAMAAGLLSLALIAWPIVKYLEFADSFGNPASSSPIDPAVAQDTLEVYEDRSFTQTAKVKNVFFKNSDVTLKNVSVNDYVIVDGIASSGKIRLEDMDVGAAVSIKSTGINTLELFNVHAERVIINNPSTDMTISLSGATDVGIFEIRTPSTVSQRDISGDSPGVRAVTLTPADGETLVSAKLDGLSLTSLSTAAENSVLTFENNTRAETMTSDGSLSLSGSGRVVNLSVGAGIGQGAGEADGSKNINVLVKDVTVTNLSVKSSANLNLATTVDNVTTSDPLNIGGAGSVGTLTLNQRADGGRLPVDIAGLSIQNVYSNAQSRINITGSARVNVLTADASVYVLGNKVNKLIANSNDVIYENLPDQTIVSAGVLPPQSVADNPHIDYSLGSNPSVSSLPGGDYSTSCGHPVESGGFASGNGSKDSPFEVTSPLQLAHVAAHPDSYFIQTADIDIAAENRFAEGFAPICSTETPFAGFYDGGGYSVANLKIVASGEGTGLFAANKGTIQNVRLASGQISSTAAVKAYVGGIAGVNLEGGSMRSCSNGAAISGNQYTYTGGITGLSRGGKVHDCYNYGNVSGVDGVGGLVGINDGGASITGSYNAGIIDGRNETGSLTGSNRTGSTVANCYFLEDTAPFGIGGGSGTATGKTAESLADPQAAADLAAGNESSLWIPGTPSGYPYPVHRKPY